MATRKATFNGRFYPGNPAELKQLFNHIEKIEKAKLKQLNGMNRLIGGVVPHAGFIYSGYHAYHFYHVLQQKTHDVETLIIVNPNHTGKGIGAFNLCGYDAWETPIGFIEIDKEISKKLDIEYASSAHEDEHSGEVQLPFIQQYTATGTKVVLITMNIQSHNNALLLAKKIHDAVLESRRKCMVLASSDFSHFETVSNGHKKDQLIIDEIIRFNAEAVANKVNQYHITTCGYGPVMTLMEYAKLVSPSPKMALLRRGHSGETTPSDRVVDYVSFACFD